MPNNSSAANRPRTVVLPGRDITNTTNAKPPTNQFLKIEPLLVAAVDTKLRAARDETPPEKEVQPGDVVEIELKNGTRQWYAVRQLPEVLAELQTAQGQRSTRQAVEALQASDQLEIPAVWASGAATRGIGESLAKLGINIVSLLRPHLEESLENVIASNGPELAAKLIAEHFEKKLEGQINSDGDGIYRGQEGLYRFTKPQSLSQAPLRGTDLNNNLPYLLFIHGTASSTLGSFGRLSVRHGFDVLKLSTTPEWEQLQQRYNERVVAYEHRTLSRSPFENALQLAKTLPDGARLHLVTHSRGGLVGELLCLSQVKELNNAGLLKTFRERLELPFHKGERTDDIATLRQLLDVLASKRLQVERFVRVACPARGTKLASQRINDFFSSILNLLEFLPWMKAHPLAEFARATLLALLKYPTNPQQLPGIEAMMPEAPLIKMLNNLSVTTESDLAVIEGDIEPGELADRLKYGVVEALFREENDLVVNTRAMTGGMKRTRPIFKLTHQGQEVSHFSYFNNHKTRRGLLSWLTLDELSVEAVTKAGFEPVKPETARPEISRSVRSAQTANAPVVFVLPGLMGSHLRVRNERVWIDQGQLALGDLEKLHIEAAQVEPETLLAAYGNLVEALKARHEVIPFAYDWRLSLRESAQRLQEAVKLEMSRHERPIRFLAHGEGGLVVRQMIAANQPLWNELKKRDTRLVMLGTPNGGSFAALQLLHAQGQLFELLALVDMKNTSARLLEIISSYPGVSELLPAECFDETQWAARWASNEQSLTVNGAPAATPPDKSRAQAAAVRQQFIKLIGKKQFEDAAQLREQLKTAVDKERMVYVAGAAVETPSAIRLELPAADDKSDKKDELVFYATMEGDGQVTHHAGQLAGIPTWYVDVEHGALVKHEPSFVALNELLEKGTTRKLATTPPSARGNVAATWRALRKAPPQMFPDENDLAAAALGQTITVAPAPPVHSLRVSVVHTDLLNARYPVAVGHYKNDVLVGAERALDRALNGRLSQLSQLGIYPGDVSTAEVVRIKDADVQGALIVGLGEFGEARRDRVRNGVTAVALRYALRVLNESDQPTAQGWRSAAFSALLLGTYSSGQMTIADSVSAIIQGALQANRLLRRQGLWDEVRIDEVEIVELYEDIATQAAHAVRLLTEYPPVSLEDDEALVFDPPQLRWRDGGRPQRPPDMHAHGWWRRLQIAVDRDKPQPRAANDDKAQNNGLDGRQRRLKFTLMTERARIEEQMIPSQRALIEDFIDQAVNRPRRSQQLGMTLFELLIPNSFKNEFGAEGDWLLFVDRESAQYPWELMSQRTRGTAAPLFNERGLIRQLATSEFRVNPQAAQGKNVLIVAPEYDGAQFAKLPGAQAEARAVKSLLEAQNDLNVIARIGKEANAPEVIYQLLANDYRIIHLAGHGHYEAPDDNEAVEQEARSGMVLSERSWLTAAEIEQLPVVPDLVFINCCFLGAIEREPRANKLAASIALSLIKMGVKAVVAAGWAVDDGAAQTFAEEFYTRLLDNQTFGMAVRSARERVYREFPDSNTWGAYQCYGNPDFRLYGMAASGARDGKGAWLSPREYRNELRRFAEDARITDADAVRALRTHLEGLYDSLPADWLDAEMLAVLGNAWAALGETGESVRFYERALGHEQSNLTLRDIQNLANLAGRQARAASHAASDETKRAELVSKHLAREFELLTQLESLSKTTHLLSLFGSHYKRRAQLEKVENLTANLQKAAERYHLASELARTNTGKVNPYPALNWALCQTLLNKLAANQSEQQKIEAQTERVLSEVLLAAKSLTNDSDIWKRLHYPDALLLDHLLHGTLAQESEHDDVKMKNRARVERAYGYALQQGRINRTELDAVLGQYDFLSEMLSRIKKRWEQESATGKLPDKQVKAVAAERDKKLVAKIEEIDEQMKILQEMRETIRAKTTRTAS